MKIELSKSFKKKLAGRIESYEFDVGILDDSEHRQPVEHGLFEEPKLGSWANGPIRKASRQGSGLTLGEVLIRNMMRLNIDILRRPFQETNSEIIKFTQAFLKMATSQKMSIKRVENLLQAVVRNPIINQEYGKNSASTADAKGFNRLLIDTGQMVKALKARAKRVRK